MTAAGELSRPPAGSFLAAHGEALMAADTSPRHEAVQRFRWSGGVWWACQDLNLGPHPYQLTAGNRCADRRFRRSRPTVRTKVMWSIGAQL
jgi:hypothetical protein